jgi:hypothetical protein
MRLASSLLLALALGASVVAPAADAARTAKYSGSILAIDPRGGVLVVDEVGPWRVDQGTTATRRTIALTPATRFNTFIRVDVPGRFAGDFIEVALDAEDLTPGEFVTAECGQERGRLVAVRVTRAEVR